MQGFTEKIVGMMKSEKLFASQGGPIILSQASIIVFLRFGAKVYGGVTAYGDKQLRLVASTSC
jgi:hypothetical protein